MENASEGTVPKQQKQKPVQDEALPRDPAERKRVLNVLAQRRYRRRKREQQVQLEGFINALNGSPAIKSRNGVIAMYGSSGESAETPTVQETSEFIFDASRPSGSTASSSNQDSASSTRSQSEAFGFTPPSSHMDSTMSDMDFDSLLNLPPDNSGADLSTQMTLSQTIPPQLDWPNDLGQDSSDDFALQLSSFLQYDDIQNTTFADDFLVSVPELDLLRAARTIAKRLNSLERLFDANANSIFVESPHSVDWSLLPPNLQPTQSQLSLPHHPILDLLPWPKVRTKLITMFNMPPEAWPKHPQDQSTMTPFRLVCDMEDGGIRVYGDDPTTEVSWEIQQNLVDAWWWALDHGVLCLSNQRKKAKGDVPLTMGLLTN